MTTSLNLSKNELQALMRRTFEALYGHGRDYYDMARSALWLECHGHKGVELLIEAMPVLEKTDLPDPVLTELSDTYYRIDGGGHSLFCIGRSVADIAIANAEDTGVCHIDIVNIYDQKPLLGVLYCVAMQGLHASLAFDDVLAFQTQETAYPTLYRNTGATSLRLSVSRTADEFAQNIARVGEIIINGDAQDKIHAATLEKGLNIPTKHYAVLNAIADRVLVESTEASRRGAGE